MAAKKVNYTVKVTAKSGLNYRSSPSLNGKKKGVYPYNKQLQVDQEDNGWYRVKTKNVWISKQYTTIVNGKKSPSKVNKKDAEKGQKLTKKEQKVVNQNVLSGTVYSDYDNSQYSKALTTSLNGIYGIPYQFMPLVDPRLVKTTKRKANKGDTKRKELGFGRVYNEKIISTMPLLLITPGSSNFLPSFNKKQKSAILNVLSSTVGALKSKVQTNLTAVMGNTNGRLYTFQFNYYDYFNYVNTMLRYCARMMDIDKYVYSTGGKGYSAKLGDFKWQKALTSNFKNFISAAEVIPFYVDAESSINESLSNQTTQSMFASTINDMSEYAREVQFLLGPVAGIRRKPADADAYKKKLDEINDKIDAHLGGAKLFKNIAEAFKTVTSGGKLVFPEVWQDSDYSKTYDVSIKLRTPDGDKISWYINILVPLIHLLALAAPQQLGANGYKSPFLVRASYKGLFNCDLGIITSLSITKGREGAWTVDGLPTEVDVEVQLKDLYSSFFISNNYKPSYFMANTCLIDYLANTCGININKPEVQRMLEIYIKLHTDKLKDLPSNIFLKMNQNASNLALSAYNGITMRNKS